MADRSLVGHLYCAGDHVSLHTQISPLTNAGVNLLRVVFGPKSIMSILQRTPASSSVRVQIALLKTLRHCTSPEAKTEVSSYPWKQISAQQPARLWLARSLDLSTSSSEVLLELRPLQGLGGRTCRRAEGQRKRPWLWQGTDTGSSVFASRRDSVSRPVLRRVGKAKLRSQADSLNFFRVPGPGKR